ncbi:phage tail tube protein [Chitinilyticum aquatile]|uniref:phage tail tube protein n=1 Tax=Chitinilyticum aquatile TaxID=362520 RepID=UPI0003F876BD|nr:phage tail tube protein [Chitinilyticum aquatile]
MYFPEETRIFFQSAESTPQNITAVTAGSPAVITYAGTDPANGDLVALYNVFGMTQIDQALVQVSNVNAAANTFEAKDQNFTGYDAFASGQMKVVTMANEITIATGFSSSGGEPEYAEWKLLWDKIKRKKQIGTSAISFEIPLLWEPLNPQMLAIQQAADAGKTLAFKFRFKGGMDMLFFGEIAANSLPTSVSDGQAISTKITISMNSRPRYVSY